MAIPITIPRLGWNMEEGVFLGWLKEDGDTVRAGDLLFRLESEKATEDIECHDGGILRIAPGAPQDGDTVPVGRVIGHLTMAGEELQIEDFKLQIEEPAAVAPMRTPTRQIAMGTRQSAISPRARRVAAELGVDCSHLQGSGRNGRIRERDVRAAAGSLSGGHRLPISGIRKATAERLRKSRDATVSATLTTTADVGALVRRRVEMKAAGQTAPSVTDFFVKAAALALQQHPMLAARWGDDHLWLPDKFNIGVAVDTDAGLLVPVVHDAAALNVHEISVRTRDLIERAESGKLTTKEMTGGVFTITNLGMFGIDAFTPVINWPECAVLGIGRIRRVPIFVDDKVMPRDEVTLGLTFDHRIVDGAPAARFLQTLVRNIESVD